MTKSEIKALDQKYVVQSYGRFDAAIERGSGAKLYSPEGREYIDFTSGIGVNSVGYGNEKLAAAVSEQMGKLAHISNLFYSEPYARLAERLCERTGMERVFFANSGAEANEGAIKLARKYSFDKYNTKKRSTVVTLVNSFHGRTISTLAATGQEVFHQYFFPFTEGFRHAVANDLNSLDAACSGGDVCAVMMELVQGEGGVLPLERDFVLGVEKKCRENDWLLIIDEVQTGVGRTGPLFAFQDFGIEPDVVSFAKGIAGGLPLGGFMTGKRTAEVFGPGTHATTFGGNPVCCAAALAVLDILDDETLKEVEEKGAYIRSEIEKMGIPQVKGTRGAGLMIGVILEGAEPKDTAAKLIGAGLLCLTAGRDALRFLPPLTITKEEIDAGLAIFREVMMKL